MDSPWNIYRFLFLNQCSCMYMEKHIISFSFDIMSQIVCWLQSSKLHFLSLFLTFWLAFRFHPFHLCYISLDSLITVLMKLDNRQNPFVIHIAEMPYEHNNDFIHRQLCCLFSTFSGLTRNKRQIIVPLWGWSTGHWWINLRKGQ